MGEDGLHVAQLVAKHVIRSHRNRVDPDAEGGRGLRGTRRCETLSVVRAVGYQDQDLRAMGGVVEKTGAGRDRSCQVRSVEEEIRVEVVYGLTHEVVVVGQREAGERLAAEGDHRHVVAAAFEELEHGPLRGLHAGRSGGHVPRSHGRREVDRDCDPDPLCHGLFVGTDQLRLGEREEQANDTQTAKQLWRELERPSDPGREGNRLGFGAASDQERSGCAWAEPPVPGRERGQQDQPPGSGESEAHEPSSRESATQPLSTRRCPSAAGASGRAISSVLVRSGPKPGPSHSAYSRTMRLLCE